MADSQYFHSNGKLLISGEYFVLEGALALALPTKFGQGFFARKSDKKEISWRSLDEQNEKWFYGRFDLENLEKLESNHLEIAEKLITIFQYLKNQKPSLFDTGWDFQTRLEFNKNWGLGTSSTLIANIAKWAGIDPYHLLASTFGGSGYDIACAYNHQALFFKKTANGNEITLLDWKPIFYNQIYFVYLGNKKNSREGIQTFKAKEKPSVAILDSISNISKDLTITKNITHFSNLLEQHETIVSEYLGIEKVKNQFFADFWGTIKSLGAWGGDFTMVVSTKSYEDTKEYFLKKGYSTLYLWDEMIK